MQGRPQPPVSPRTLQERLDHPAAATTSGGSHTLLERVNGGSTGNINGRNSSWSSRNGGDDDDDLRGGRDLCPTNSRDVPLAHVQHHQDQLSLNPRLSAPSLGARIAQESAPWPTRGQQSSWRPVSASGRPPSSEQRSSSFDETRLNKEVKNSRSAAGPSITATYEASTSVTDNMRDTRDGPIRVSEEGEVWRSPPQRPVADSIKYKMSAASSNAAAQVKASSITVRGIGSSAAPIAIPSVREHEPGFSPLPPFARNLSATSGPTSTRAADFPIPRKFRPVPQQQNYRFNNARLPSRPPEVHSASSSQHPSTSRSAGEPYLPSGSVPAFPPIRYHTSLNSNLADRQQEQLPPNCVAAPASRPFQDAAIFMGPKALQPSTHQPTTSERDVSTASVALRAAEPSNQYGEETTPREGFPSRYKNASWKRQPTPEEPSIAITDATATKNMTPISSNRAASDTSSTKALANTTYPSAQQAAAACRNDEVPRVKVERISPTTAKAAPCVQPSRSRDSMEGSASTAPSRFPVSSRNVTKQESVSPQKPSQADKQPVMPPTPSRPTNQQPLFSNLSQSPEERKPALPARYTPPPRRTALPHLDANTATERSLPRRPLPPYDLPNDVTMATNSLNTQAPLQARDVAAARAAQRRKQTETVVVEIPPRNTLSASQAMRRETSGSCASVSSKTIHAIASGSTPRQASTTTHITRVEAQNRNGSGEADMEIDELESDDPSYQPLSRHKSPTAATRSKAGPSAARTASSANSLEKAVLPPQQASKSVSKQASAPRLETVPAPSRKGKERAVDVDMAGVIHIDDSSDEDLQPLPLESVASTKSKSKSAGSSKAARASQADLVFGKDKSQTKTKSKPSSPSSTSNKVPVEPTPPVNKTAQAAPLPPPLNRRVSAVRPANEERTRLFRLPPKLVISLAKGTIWQKASYRRFLDECYEALELESQQPLQRLEEIPREDSMRLVYIELQLPAHEIAIPLPRECLQSSTGTSEEREERRRAFAIQQVVRFAKDGREPETTRMTPAYLIVVLADRDNIKHTRGSSSGVLPTKADAASAYAIPGPASTADEQSKDISMASDITQVDQNSILPKSQKKRKRLEELSNDAASISSNDSVASSKKKKDKIAKQLKKSSTVAPSAKAPDPKPKLPDFKHQTTVPPAIKDPAVSISSSSAKSAILDARARYGKPQLQSIPHSMHGSLSHKLKDSREKPRIFFPSRTVLDGHPTSTESYVTMSMRGHVHLWRPTSSNIVLLSEDTDIKAAASLQTALWSEEHRLAVLGYVSGNATASGDLHLVQMYGKGNKTKGRRRIYVPTAPEDQTGLSALAWDPNASRGIRMVGAGNTDRNIRIWSVTPGSDEKDPKMAKRLDVRSRHSSWIRSILWQPESDKILTAGSDKRVCIFDPHTYQTVDERKENLPINRLYRIDANVVLLCLAGISDQFRCVDLREGGTRVARTFSLPTKKGDTLGQYAHGDVFNNLFAYPVDDDLYIWDLRNTSRAKQVAGTSGIVQPHFETERKIALLEKKHFTQLRF